MRDEDIYAFNPVPPHASSPPRPARRLWPWVLAGLAALLALLVVSGGVALASWLAGGHEGVHISIDGEDGLPGWTEGFAGMVAFSGVGLGLLAALLVGLLTVGLVLPLTLLLALLGLAVGVGGAALVFGVMVALLLSPLWALALLLWLVLRPARKATIRP